MPELGRMLEDLITEKVRQEVARVLGQVKQTAEYMSSKEAAEFARVSQGTVRRWIREGRLDDCGAGREVRVKREQIAALMHGGRRRAPRRSTLDASAKMMSPEQLAAQDDQRRGLKKRQRVQIDTRLGHEV